MHESVMSQNINYDSICISEIRKKSIYLFIFKWIGIFQIFAFKDR